MFISERLKKCREEKNLTQTDLIFELDKAGLRISRQTLLNWEAGDTVPGVDDLAIISRYFDKQVQYFFNQ